MNIRLTILILVLIPIVVAGGFAVTHRPMNATVVALLGALMIWLAYTRYARRIDREVVQPDAKKATPAGMYMDGVDYVTTMAAMVVTGYNLYASILSNPKIAAQPVNVMGALAMIIVSALLFVASVLIAYDAWRAWSSSGRLRSRRLNSRSWRRHGMCKFCSEVSS